MSSMAVQKPVYLNWVFRAVLFTCFLSSSLAGCSIGSDLSQPSPTAILTEEPTNTVPLLPDLVILSVAVEGDPSLECLSTNQSHHINVTVENRGNAPGGPFVIQLNLDQQLVNSRLAPGQRIDLLFPEFQPNSRAIVDITSLVTESDESNNLVFQHLELPTPSPKCLTTATPLITTHEAQAVLEGHTADVLDVEFSPDGRTIASGSVDDTLRLWTVEPSRLIRTMQGHPFPILILRFSPNGSVLYTGSTDGILRAWQVTNGNLLHTLHGHTGWITGLDITRDGKWLASSAEDSTVRLWRLPNGAPVQVIDEGMVGVKRVTFTPDSYAVFWGEADGKVRQRTISGIWLESMKGASRAVTCLEFSPDGITLASGDEDGAIRIFRKEDGAQLQVLQGHRDAISDLAYSPDGQWLVSASHDGTLRLWRLNEQSFFSLPVMVFVGHTGPVTSVDFSPNGLLVASGSGDKTIRLWTVPQS
jgi:WD40 repeat protein